MPDTAAEKCPSKLTGIGASGAVDPCERPAGHGGDHAARNGELVWEDWGDRPTCEQRIAEAVAAAVKPWRDGVAARVPDTYCPDESDGPADLLPGLDDAVARAVAAERERCERIAKKRSSRREVSPWSMGWRDCADAIAAAIRGGDDAGS